MRTTERRAPAAPPESRPFRRRVKVADEIIEALRQDIVTRRLSDGERLPNERELSDRFGVSQPTIREAIRALETLGLVEVLHGNGSFVRSQGGFALASALQTLLQLESVGVMEVLDIRQVLGRRSIELAAVAATKEELDELATTCARFDQLGKLKEVDDVIGLIIGFQRRVSAASHNPLLQSLEAFLLALLNEVQVQSLTGRGVRFWRARAMAFQPYREAILDGLRSRDAGVARGAMDRYFEAQRNRFDQDESLRALNLSHPRLVSVVADMVRDLRT